MKVSMLLLLALMLTACDSPTESVGSLSGTYRLVRCERQFGGPTTPPCQIAVWAGWTNYLDSASVRFDGNGTVHWMLGTHTHSCTCDPNNFCGPPCQIDPDVVQNESGTAIRKGDSIELRLPSGPVTLEATLWVPFVGPQTLKLAVYGSRGSGVGVFERTADR